MQGKQNVNGLSRSDKGIQVPRAEDFLWRGEFPMALVGFPAADGETLACIERVKRASGSIYF